MLSIALWVTPCWGQSILEAYRAHLEAHARMTPIDPSAAVAGNFPSFTEATPQDWAELIDQTWGPGLPDDTKLELFDALWTYVDEEYGAYMNLEVDIDAIREGCQEGKKGARHRSADLSPHGSSLAASSSATTAAANSGSVRRRCTPRLYHLLTPSRDFPSSAASSVTFTP